MMSGSTSRRSASARERAIARSPAGWIPSMISLNASTGPAGGELENIVGIIERVRSSGGASAARRVCCKRCSMTSSGREPAQPA